jgi:hypothetical protein
MEVNEQTDLIQGQKKIIELQKLVSLCEKQVSMNCLNFLMF